MKTVHIISSIKNLNYDYEHLQWLRMFFLNRNMTLSEDWIHHSLSIKNNKPYFSPAPNFDYMKVATNSINSSDLIVFLMSDSSTFSLTMLRYSIHVQKPSIVIYNNKSDLKELDVGSEDCLTTINLKKYKKELKELL